MKPAPDLQPWPNSALLESDAEPGAKPQEFERLWRGFMTGRVTLGLVLVLLQATIYFLGTSKDTTQILICIGYFGTALAVRLLASPHALGQPFDVQWISTIGVDILAFAVLQVAPGNSINYAPLFVLPVLMAAVLGSLLLALGAAAGVTLLLFAYAAWTAIQVPGDTSAYFLQAALTGAGCFVISLLAHQVATRLANVELLAQRSQLAARVQRQVNELVIESLTDGILVVDLRGSVRAANPAARLLLGNQRALDSAPFDLTGQIAWQGLVNLMRLSFSSHRAGQADVTIHHVGQGPRRVRVRTQLTTKTDGSGGSLCVMFLQDQREMEAHMRTEKMASMGRMSTAVAHEIRNPLAAITQANDLLDEELLDPKHKQFTQMVRQNAKRLEKIVEDVLNISNVQQREMSMTAALLDLNATVIKICDDWQAQTSNMHPLRVNRWSSAINVRFEADHLRRVLVNLLDNARRYASHRVDAIQVSVSMSSTGQGVLSVWSDGLPMDQTVERHLFEPFFSSESRSSGLGLYICRELCEGYGASIVYYRTRQTMGDQRIEGNDFLVSFQTGTARNNS